MCCRWKSRVVVRARRRKRDIRGITGSARRAWLPGRKASDLSQAMMVWCTPSRRARSCLLQGGGVGRCWNASRGVRRVDGRGFSLLSNAFRDGPCGGPSNGSPTTRERQGACAVRFRDTRTSRSSSEKSGCCRGTVARRAAKKRENTRRPARRRWRVGRMLPQKAKK